MKKEEKRINGVELFNDMLLSYLKDFCSDMANYDHENGVYEYACGFNKDSDVLRKSLLLLYISHNKKSKFTESLEITMDAIGNNRVFALIITQLLDFILTYPSEEDENETLQ